MRLRPDLVALWCNEPGSPSGAGIVEAPLPELRSYLTDGFSGDHVVVRVNGQTVLDKSVATKKLYGLAERLPPIQVPGSSAKVEVQLPDRNIGATFDVDLSQGSHVPIALEDGELRHSVHKSIGFM